MFAPALRFLFVCACIVLAAWMLIGLANARTASGGHGGGAHSKSAHKDGEAGEGPVSTSHSPGEPEAEVPHTNTYISGTHEHSASEAEAQTDGGTGLSDLTRAFLIFGAVGAVVLVARKH